MSSSRQTTAAQRWIVVCVLVLTGVALTTWMLTRDRRAAAPATTPAAVPVMLQTVQQRDVPQYARGIGSVQSLQSVTLRPQVEGVLAEVHFDEGQLVSKGQLLARIDDREYRAALLQAQAQQASAESQLRAAELDLQRFTSLAGEMSIPRQTVELQAALVEQRRAAVQAAEAAVATAQVRLSYTRIVSPVAGRVGLRRVDEGNLVRTSDADGLVTVTQINPISVLFTLPQDRLGDIGAQRRDGAEPPVTVSERDGGATLATGRLTTIDNQIDAATGTIQLRAEFANADGRLWPGQLVSAQLLVGTRRAALTVPARSVRQGLNGAYVFRVRDAVADVVPVRVAWQDDDLAVIDQGLEAGDRIVVDGYSRLRAGTPVKELTSPADAGTPQ